MINRRILPYALLWAVIGTTGCTVATTDVILREAFVGPECGPEWGIDASGGNTIAINNGTLEIRAAENTHAHIERRLDIDYVRASCSIKPASGVSWCTSLFLYWSPGTWCQMGIIPRGDGRYYACITSEGQRSEHDLTRCRFTEWHPVAIELGQDCIRFLSGADGGTWKTELLVARPESMSGPPALLVVGKGFGLDATQPDLDGDYGDRGPLATSFVRHVVVERTDAARMTITPEERRDREQKDQDPLGTQILSRPGDPTYDAVAAVLPALSKPREAVGVKDHLYEIGVEYDGTIQIPDDTPTWEQTGTVAFFELGTPPVRFGAGGCTKHLLRGYLPVVVAESNHERLACRETVFGWSEGLSADRELYAYCRLQVTNQADREKDLNVVLRFTPDTVVKEPLSRHLRVAPGGTAEVCLKIALPLKAASASEIDADEFENRLEEVTQGWSELLNRGMAINVPEPRINDAYRAWLAYNYLDVDKKGDVYEPHDGAGFYEQVYGYSAALYCHALDLWGRHEDSRRYLESLLTFLRPDGLFFVNYGLPDHGALLLALCEHYRMTGDDAWLRRMTPDMLKMCDWVVAQRRRSTSTAAEPKTVTYGLIRFTPYADYQSQTVNYYADAYCCVGLQQTARAFQTIGMEAEAGRLADEAASYRNDILHSMDAAVFERDGMKLLPMEPDTHRLFKSTNDRGGGYYGLVASMFLESEFLEAADKRAQWVVGALERRRGLILGMCEFDDGVDHAYTYGYWLNCLRRDDVRRVLLGFYGTLAYGMGRDTYCGVEVTQIITGEPTPTTPHLYSGTQQLRLLRMMLLREEADRLLIGHAIPGAWLEAGKRIEVRNAATAFGPVSFLIESGKGAGEIRMQLDTPAARPPASVEIRLRHPAGRRLTRATVNGQPVSAFTHDTLSLPPHRGSINVRLAY
jgi:hypothetical protein